MTKKGPYTGPWFDDRNERRKERYHSEADYRSKENKAARDGYRKAAGSPEPFDPRTNVWKFASFGSLRDVDGSTDGAVLTFSKSEMADLLGRPVKQVRTWIADGRLPKTAVRARGKNDIVMLDCYTQKEAAAIIESLGPFLADLLYFRKDNAAAITSVYSAVDEVRKSG